MSNRAKTHEESKKTVFFLCLGKTSRFLTSFMTEKMQQILKQPIDFNDPKVPTGMCERCHSNLRRVEEGKLQTQLQLFDFSNIKVRRVTRDSVCDCLICSVGKAKHNSPHPVMATQKPKANQNSVERRCSQCFSIVGKGLSHSCSKSTLRKNLAEVVSKGSVADERVAASVIANKEASPHGTVLLSRPEGIGGHSIPVLPGNIVLDI